MSTTRKYKLSTLRQTLILFALLFYSLQTVKAQATDRKELAISFVTGLYEGSDLTGSGSGVKTTFRSFKKNPRFQIDRNLVVSSHKQGFANGIRIQEFLAVTAQYVVNYDFASIGPVHFGLYAGPSLSLAEGESIKFNLQGSFDVIKFNRIFGAIGFGLKIRVGGYDAKYGFDIGLPNTQLGTEGLYELSFSIGAWIKL